MKFSELPKILSFSKDLLDIFTDYDFSLFNYFKEEKNKKEHSELYNEYLTLTENVKKLKEKYKL